MNIFNLIGPLFLLITLGYILKKLNFFDENFKNQLNKLVYYIALPILLFNKTSNLNIEELNEFSIIFGFPIIIISISLIAFLFTLYIKKSKRGTFIQCAFRSNITYLGLPIIIAVLGDNAIGYAAMIIMVGTISNVLLSVFILDFFNPKSNSKFFNKIKTAIINPLIISIGLGFIFSYLKIKLPLFLTNTLTLVSNISLPLILIIIGFSFSFLRIKKYMSFNIFNGIIKLGIMPLFAFFLMKLFNPSEIIIQTVVLMAAMPSAIVSQTFAQEFNSDEKLTSSLINFNTLMAAFTIPLIIYLLGIMG